jgi:alpha-beta hydrolase superfamily lysophospholipase
MASSDPIAGNQHSGTTLKFVSAPPAEMDADAHEIPMRRWSGRDNSGVVLVCLHNFGDYHQAFAEIAEKLVDHGHIVLAYDQRGSGSTPAPGYFASAAAYRGDLGFIVDHARVIARQGQPVVVLGEGFGATVALSALAAGEVDADAFVLASPTVRENASGRAFWEALSKAAATLLDSHALPVPSSDRRYSERARLRLSSDPQVLQELRATTVDRLMEFADEASLAVGPITAPALVLYGEEDAFVGRSSIDALMRRLGRSASLRLYPRLPHLVLQAAEREDVETDLLHFLSTLQPE